MKSSKNILDFFKIQNTNVPCPACGILLPKSKLNVHLDSDCISSDPTVKKTKNLSSEIGPNSSSKSVHREVDLNRKKKMKKSAKTSSKSSFSSSRLSLKQQKINAEKKNVGKTLENVNFKFREEPDVITIDDDSLSSNDNNIDISKAGDNLVNAENNSDNIKYKPLALKEPSFNNSVGSSTSMQCADDIDCEEIVNSSKTKYKRSLNSITVEKNLECDYSPAKKCNQSNEIDNNEAIGSPQKFFLKESDNCINKVDIKDLDSNFSSFETNNQISSIEKVEPSHTENKELFNTTISHNRNTFHSNQSSAEENNQHSTTGKTLDCTESVSIDRSNHKMQNDCCESKRNMSDVDADVIAVLNDAEECVDVDDNVFSANSKSDEQSANYSPYYIANFKHILKTVLSDDYNKALFNEEDTSFVHAFESASDSAQKLYVRLFQRKYKWLRLNKINYPKITNDTKSVLDELVNIGLVDLGSDKIDLETALDLLSLPEAKTAAKQFKFNLSGKSKTDITKMFLKHCKEHKSVFFCNGRNSVSNMMLKKIKDVLGPCYRISLLPKRLFTRILMLFSLPTISEDDDDAAGGQQLQLLMLLQVNKGEVTFPDYKINREIRIFVDRDELIRYEEAKQLENDIMNAVEIKNFDLAKELYFSAKDEFENQLLSPFVERAASLPTFLKKYTSFHIYVRCMTQGVEIFQRLRQYKEAVELLQRLLDQKVFCQDYRGRWWDRMALNLEQHLKQRQQALEAIKKGMKDHNVRVGHRYSLLTRALRILKSVEADHELKNEIIEATNVIEAPKIVIKGRLFPRSLPNRRHVFISSSSALNHEDDITVLNVEQLAIEHYKNEGFTEGIHGESSTFHALYGLLFWDIIYDGDIPNAFISPYQTHPLDLNHESFFERREKQILSHLETLKTSTIEEIKEIVKSSFEAHFGQTSLVMWDRFTDVEHVLGLVGCMGSNLLCGICERLAKDFRFTRSGVPDLVVWNPESLQVKIVEVKGPGDKLSSKQILWLDYLLKLGAQAEVCHVEAVGSKKLRKE